MPKGKGRTKGKGMGGKGMRGNGEAVESTAVADARLPWVLRPSNDIRGIAGDKQDKANDKDGRSNKFVEELMKQLEDATIRVAKARAKVEKERGLQENSRDRILVYSTAKALLAALPDEVRSNVIAFLFTDIRNIDPLLCIRYRYMVSRNRYRYMVSPNCKGLASVIATGGGIAETP